MPFKKGEKRGKDFHAATRDGRYKANGATNCYICGKQVSKYNSKQKLCSDRECIKENTRRRYKAAKESDPLLSKAITLSGSIRLGKNKRTIMLGMLKRAVGNPCEYCGSEVTLENASIDHKTPRTFSKVHNKKKSKLYTPEEIRELDKEENLHIVCRDCNQLKSDMNDEQFRYFLSAISTRQDVKELVVKRMRRAVFMFGRR